MRARSVAAWAAGVIAILSLGSAPAQAQTVGPLANTTVGNARLIVPDGSSVRQSISTGETRWFVFGAEPGKTYVVEAVDPDSDLVSDTIGALNVYAADGTTTPPVETNVDCTAGTRAPALEVPVAVDGMRCVVRAFPPSPGNTQNKRGLYVAVGSVSGPSFAIRVRESTIYGRWTTNGYDFHVELENTTGDAMCAQMMFLPNSGNSYAGTWSGAVTTQTLTIPPFGANKLVFPNGTLVGSDLRGTLRIGACSSPVNLMPSGLHVSTYAFNPGIGQYLYFFTTTANNGAASNSWNAASSGTVTSIATGAGLTGGPITTSGTINLAATNLLPTVACAANQVPKWNGSAWTCAADNNSGGTVISVGTGSGLTGGPITGSGTINLAGTQLLPTVACATNQIPKWTGSAWACGADNAGPVNAFVKGGNAFGTEALLGTTDNQPLTVLVNNQPTLRLNPVTDANDTSTVNVINGSPLNSIDPGVVGATIAGGGGNFSGTPNPNHVAGSYATIGGGQGNAGSGGVSTVAGGYKNTASGGGSSVGGGEVNIASGGNSTVAGGQFNTASGTGSTVAGGFANSASGLASFAAGVNAIAAGDGSFVWADNSGFDFDATNGPGGWGSNRPNTFSVRATGGVWFATAINGSGTPTIGVEVVSGSGSWSTYSDRSAKSNLAAVDPLAVLDRVVHLPVSTWNYNVQDVAIRHIGPMAQDFHAAFGVGENDTMISVVDAQGVALAAIQGLNAKVQEQASRIGEQQREIAHLHERVTAAESLRGELAALRAELADLRENRTQITAAPHAAADSF